MAQQFLTSFHFADAAMTLRAIVPCLLVVLVGYAIGRVDRGEHEKTFSSLIYFVFFPCLVFTGLHRHSFRYPEIAALALGAGLSILLMLGLALAFARVAADTQRGEMLSLVFASTGTLLMPLAYLLYGNEGLAKAAMLHLFTSLFFFTFGSLLFDGTFQPWRFFRSPTFVAAVIGLSTANLNSEFFQLLERGVDIVSYGALPFLLLSFGYPLSQLKGPELKRGFPGGAVRMLAGPLAAFLVVLLLRKIGIVTTAKGYNILNYVDQRTTEAVIVLSGALPGAVSCYLVTKRQSGDAGKRSLALLMASGLIGSATIPFTLLMVNFLILSR